MPQRNPKFNNAYTVGLPPQRAAYTKPLNPSPFVMALHQGVAAMAHQHNKILLLPAQMKGGIVPQSQPQNFKPIYRGQPGGLNAKRPMYITPYNQYFIEATNVTGETPLDYANL